LFSFSFLYYRNSKTAEFREYFMQFGPVTDAQIMVDHTTGRSRGFG